MSPHPRWAAFAALACLTAMAGCGRAPASAHDPTSAANAFFAALQKGDPHQAYDNSAFGFQAAQTYDAFLSNARDLGIVGGQPPIWTGTQAGVKDTELNGSLLSQNGGPIGISVTMTRDDGQWRLFSLQTATGAGGGQFEDRFTLVGKGTGFNDVYHQPMPNPQQLVDLVQETMSKFNDAVRARSFHDFYLWVSQQWRDGIRTNGEEAAGVTENMLDEHFQAFMDKKIDLGSLASIQPIFDQPPYINQDGLLELTGHFNTPQFRLDFQFQYAYELPRWRLFGLNLGVRN